MVFHSYIFIILFLPLALVVFYLVGRENTKASALFYVLIAASLLFYAAERFEMILFLVGEVGVNYLFYILIKQKHSKAWLATAIIVNVGLLCYTKYLGMAVSVMNAVIHTNIEVKNISAPLGISFITFQQIAFLIYGYRNKERDINILEYSVFTTFFPHISQGPILEPSDYFEGQLTRIAGKIKWENMSSGILLFVIGLSKKRLLADVYGGMVDAAYASIGKLNFGSALFISFAYTLQIYFDFSGYCDMAMGVGKMFNIDLPGNFNSPYKASSIDEFWDRWHITLTRFFTKYVYIPLGGSRRGLPRTLVNIMVIFLVSGLWHGASLTFVLWGAVHGTLMVISRIFRRTLSKVPKLIGIVGTFLFVNFAWILFRAGSFTVLREMLKGFTRKGFDLIPEITEAFGKVGIFSANTSEKPFIPCLFLLIGFTIVFGCKNSVELVKENKWRVTGAVFAAVLVLICLFSFTGTESYIYLSF